MLQLAVMRHRDADTVTPAVRNQENRDKKLSYRKETVRLHDITSSSAVAEKKHSRVGQFWVGRG